MKSGVCKGCGESIVLVAVGDWIGPGGGSYCEYGDDTEGSHTPFQYPEPTTATLADDLAELSGYIREFESDDYQSQCADNGVEDSEDHIYRRAERVSHFGVLLRYAADTLAMLQKLTKGAGHAIQFDTESPLAVVHAEATVLLAQIDAETKRHAGLEDERIA